MNELNANFGEIEHFSATDEREIPSLEQYPWAIALLDDQMRFLAASQCWLDDFSLPQQTLISRSWGDLFPHPSPDWPEIYLGCLQGESYKNRGELMQLPNGAREWVKWEMKPWRSRHGRIRGVMVLGEIVTEAIAAEAQWQELFWDRKQAEEDLKQQRELLQEAIDTTPHWLCIKDWNGCFVLANRAIARAFGTTPENMIGKSMAQLNPHPEEVERFLREDREVMTELKEKDIGEEFVTTVQGKKIWIQTVKRPLFLPNTSVPHVLVSATEITRRKQIEEELQKVAALVANSSDFIGIFSLEGDPLFLNAAGVQLVGLNSPEEVREKHFLDFFPSEDLQTLQQEILPTAIARGHWQGEAYLRYFPNGEAIPVDQSVCPQSPHNRRTLVFGYHYPRH